MWFWNLTRITYDRTLHGKGYDQYCNTTTYNFGDGRQGTKRVKRVVDLPWELAYAKFDTKTGERLK